MAAIYPPVEVAAPASGPLRYGLFNAARVVDQPGIASVGGVQFQPTTCGGAHLYTAECPPSAQNVKTFDLGTETVTTAPFWAYGSIVCSPVGRTIEEQADRARQRLLAGEQTQVEAAFWNGGGVGATPNLNAIGATTVAPVGLTQFGSRLAARLPGHDPRQHRGGRRSGVRQHDRPTGHP